VNQKDGLTYVWIPPGKFMMGCSPGDNACKDDEKPPHEVTISNGFWMGKTDVTQAAYERVLEKNPSSFKGANLPTENVDWNEAESYCKAVGMRLPTEAEWEYAARAGSTESRYGDLNRIAWYSANGENQTHEVAQKQANAWGLYDMLGNVSQWTEDSKLLYASDSLRDPRGPASGQQRTLRGGAWSSGPEFVRVSGRAAILPKFHSAFIGLRCVEN
jgi:formylglycine-generating enzyme required for sulfatase activity